MALTTTHPLAMSTATSMSRVAPSHLTPVHGVSSAAIGGVLDVKQLIEDLVERSITSESIANLSSRSGTRSGFCSRAGASGMGLSANGSCPSLVVPPETTTEPAAGSDGDVGAGEGGFLVSWLAEAWGSGLGSGSGAVGALVDRADRVADRRTDPEALDRAVCGHLTRARTQRPGSNRRHRCPTSS